MEVFEHWYSLKNYLTTQAEKKEPKLDGYFLGCQPSAPDKRTYQFSVLAQSVLQVPTELPESFTSENNLPDCFEQGRRGSCTASALVWTVKAYQEVSQADWPSKGLSVAYLYAEEKKIDGMPDQEGSTIFAGLKVLQKKGVCLETTLSYSSLLNLPAPKVPATNEVMDREAVKYKIGNYAQICASNDKERNENTIKLIKQGIYANGAVVVAVVVAENFNNYDKNYIIPLPEGYLLGLHAVGLVGWDDKKQAFRLRNSWGKWGDKGYAWLPYDFVTKGMDIDGYGHIMWYLLEAWTALDEIVIDDAKEIKLIPYNTRAVVDGVEYYVDQPPIIDPTTNRTLVPIRFVSNHMGRIVSWNEATNEIIIKKLN
jgi:C1A family cysteine protease